jgi:phage host-nuclease inhibitor protein Gam
MNILSNPKRSEHDLALGALRQDNEQLGGAGEQVSLANEQASVRSSRAGLAVRVFIGLVLTAGFIIAFAKANSTATDMTEWLQTAARDLANVEQAIQQLKASQKQIVRDNAELADRLKATEEQVVRDNAAVAERLTATEAQIARDNAQIVEQLDAAQSQMAHDNAALSSELKTGVEQMTRAIAKASEKLTERASEQNPRPFVTGTIRPAVRAPQASTKPANPPGLGNFFAKIRMLFQRTVRNHYEFSKQSSFQRHTAHRR